MYIYIYRHNTPLSLSIYIYMITCTHTYTHTCVYINTQLHVRTYVALAERTAPHHASSGHPMSIVGKLSTGHLRT